MSDVVIGPGDPIQLRSIAWRLLVGLGGGILCVYLGLVWSEGEAVPLALMCVCGTVLGVVLGFRTSIREYGARTDQAGARAPAWGVILLSIPLAGLFFVFAGPADLDGDGLLAVAGSFVTGASAVLWFRIRLELRQIEDSHGETTGA